MGTVGHSSWVAAKLSRMCCRLRRADESLVDASRTVMTDRVSGEVTDDPSGSPGMALHGLRPAGSAWIALRRSGVTSPLPILVACSLVLVSCGRQQPSATPGAGDGAFQERATAVAAAWDERGVTDAWTTGFIPLQDLVVEPDWSPNDVLKASFGNGWIRTAAPLSDLSGRGVIQFADGTSLPVPLAGAQTAYSLLPSRVGDCPTDGQPPTCQWVTITSANLSTVAIATSRGPAQVPAWSFTLDGLPQPLLRVAVASSATTSPPVVELPGPNNPDGIVSAMQLESREGNVIAFDVGIGACDKGAQGLVREFPELIVVGGSVSPPEAGTICNTSLVPQRVEVRTTQPVGNRPIVDALTGRPIVSKLARP